MEELKKLSKEEWQEKIKELLENGYRAEASFLIASFTIEHGGFPDIYNMERVFIKEIVMTQIAILINASKKTTNNSELAELSNAIAKLIEQI